MGDLVKFPAAGSRPAPAAAYGMSVAVDSCGQILVRLHDEAGAIYAQATIPAAAARHLVDQVALCAAASAALGASVATIVH
jgi:hypothetical protein